MQSRRPNFGRLMAPPPRPGKNRAGLGFLDVQLFVLVVVVSFSCLCCQCYSRSQCVRIAVSGIVNISVLLCVAGV